MSVPLPEGAFHLLVADDLAGRPYGVHVAVCGEQVPASELPPSCYNEEDCEVDRDPSYCPECVREAARWNAKSAILVPPA